MSPFDFYGPGLSLRLTCLPIALSPDIIKSTLFSLHFISEKVVAQQLYSDSWIFLLGIRALKKILFPFPHIKI